MLSKMLNEPITKTIVTMAKYRYTKPIIDYQLWSMDYLRYRYKTIPFKIEEKEYKNGQEWEQSNQRKQYKNIYYGIVASSTLGFGLWGYLDEIKYNDEVSSVFAFVFGSIGGFGIGYVHPFIVPGVVLIGVPAAMIITPLYQYAKYRITLISLQNEMKRQKERIKEIEKNNDVETELKNAKYQNNSISLQNEMKIEREYIKGVEKTNDVLYRYVRYVETELKKSRSEQKIITYFTWCCENGIYKHRYGYYD